MDNSTYKRQKLEYSYALHKQRKFFKKARAIVVDGKDVLLLEVTYTDGNTYDLNKNPKRKLTNKHYLLPGGGVDEGETIKQAVIRETLEEYGLTVKAEKYLGKLYYKVPMNIDGVEFNSNRIEFYYLCKVLNENQSETFGIDGEFKEKGKVYKKVKLSLSDLEKLDASDVNDMSESVFNKLLDYLKK